MAKGDRMRSWLRATAADVLDRCTSCGKCFETCPMTPYGASLPGADSTQVVGGILDLLRGKAGNTEALDWVNVCSHSGRCAAVCPEGIDAMVMVRVAHMAACGSIDAPAQIHGREDTQFFRRINAFARLQMTDAEIAAWHD